MYGWSTRGFNNIAHSITIAAECALLLSGDYGYLDLLRSQIKDVLDQARDRGDGQLLVPLKYGPDGWSDFAPIRVKELAHLYHASMNTEDWELMIRARKGDMDRDWNEVKLEHEKNHGDSECARFQFYEGLNSDWPERVLGAEYQSVATAYEFIQSEIRNPEQLITDNVYPPNPVATKGLTQVTLGAPQSVYNGGLNRAMVRYFDHDRARPGLPPDVAALVDELKADVVGIELVNLSRTESRRAIIQAGAFGEHSFTEVRYQDGESYKTIPIGNKYLGITLPPSTSIRMGIPMKRFVNNPSYAFPWHGDKIPVPFQ